MAAAASPPRATRRTTPVVVGLAVLLGVILLLVAEPLRVTSASMSPTLVEGDHVVVDKLTGRWRAPAVGDVVVFRAPAEGGLTVKRVVAVAGSSVALEDGQLQVDGVVQVEPQVDLTRVDSVYFGPEIVPPGAVFVMGDNRGASIDSRAFGPIPVTELVGRVILHF